MPFTPFHFGPGAAVKAVIPRYFSFTVFCFAQIVTDCETAYHMVRHEYPLHRWMHTYAGATVVALFCIVVGRPVCQALLRRWREWSNAPFKPYFPISGEISLTSSIVTGFIGTYSHVFLDSIMHPDVQPFQPWSNSDPSFGIIDLFALHGLCILLGVAGGLYVAYQARKKA
jgi:Domain of unknown function (DUF4184)